MREMRAGLPNLQKRCETIRLWSGFSRSSMVDSYVSRQFPMFRIKNRRTFALFTSIHAAHLTEKYGRCLPIIRSQKREK